MVTRTFMTGLALVYDRVGISVDAYAIMVGEAKYGRGRVGRAKVGWTKDVGPTFY